MIYIFVSLISFIFTIVIQIGIHRTLLFLGRRTFATIHVISLGCLINATGQYILYQKLLLMPANGNIWLFPLPLTASFLYILLFFFYITYSASPYLGQEGPTSKILTLFRKNSSLTDQQIINTFTDQETVLARIDDLLHSGWIKKEGGYITLQGFGRVLARFILFYRTILGLQKGG